MWDWLDQSLASEPKTKISELLLRLVVSGLLGFAVARVYRLTRRAGTFPSTFPSTLLLLSILIAMVTQVIGDNVARAFSLVGALSIVRFRTVVQDTQDTAFVIFAVVVGMAVGAGQLLVGVGGLVIVSVAAVLTRLSAPPTPLFSQPCHLSMRIGLGNDPEALLEAVKGKHLEHAEVESVATAQQGGALDVKFRVRLRPGALPVEMVRQLNQIEGVRQVELTPRDDQ